MSDQFAMFEPTTCEDSNSVTSSPALESGRIPCDLPDGPTTEKSGLALAPAPVSQRQAKASGLETLVTSGRIGWDSSASVALQSSLESRLMQRLDTAGSTLFNLTWKRKVTPLGRRYLERAASALRTGGKGCTSSVPTPQSSDMTGGGQAKRAMLSKRPSGAAQSANLNDFAMLACLPTPQTHDITTLGNTEADCHYSPHDLSNAAQLSAVPSPRPPNGGRSMSTDAMDATGRTLDGRKHTASLEHTVKFAELATVPTPMAGTPATETYNAAGNNDYSRKIVELASTPSPRATDGAKGGPNQRGSKGDLMLPSMAALATPAARDYRSVTGREFEQRDNAMQNLNVQASLSQVTTPSARDWKDTSGMSESGTDPDGSTRSRLDQLPRQAQLAASGPTATGGTAETGSTGQLNPEYSRWLIGLPRVFCDCAVTATASLRKLRKSSSKP